jgi:GT2 family glycosyltransferase
MGVDVSAVIVTYNSREVVGACIESLRRNTAGVSYEVIVVDNASRDGTADEIGRRFPDVRIIARRRNAGLPAGINEGVRASAGRHVMQLNPDCRLDGDALSILATYLDHHPDVGVVAPKLLDDDGTVQMSRRAFPGYSTAFFGRYSLLTRIFPGNRFSRRYLMSDVDDATTRDVDWVSGAALMFPRAVFDRLGGWDEQLFLFSEDVDFCKRAHEAGFRVVYHPQAVVYHTIGISRRPSVRAVVERHRSMWHYYRKHVRRSWLQDLYTAPAIALRCAFALAGRLARR